MILDRIQNAERYLPLNRGFAAAFKFLRRAGLDRLPVGRHEIDGDHVYATVIRAKGRRQDDVVLEVHRNYIDIQFVISGANEMGWRDLQSCGNPSVPYALDNDAALFPCKPDSWITVGPGAFAIFFPEDAHAPLVGEEVIHKVVVKVAMEKS